MKDKMRSLLTVGGIAVAFLIVLYAFHLLLQKDYNYIQSTKAIGTRIIQDDPPPGKDFLTNHAAVQFDINYVQEHLNSLDQADPRLIQYARVRYLTPPSTLPYGKPQLEGSRSKHMQWVEKFYRKKRNGTFIEAGANDGMGSSHTYYLEKQLGWTGLLVECNPLVIPSLKTAHRKAWIGTVCLAPAKTPGTLKFNNPANWQYSGRLGEPWKLKLRGKLTPWSSFDVETVPLYTLLAATGMNEIDFFLFDVEGSELNILKTVPFDKIIFRVLIIEIYFYSKEEKEELNTLLVSNGYHFATDIDIDKVYVHKSVKHLLKE